MTPTTRSVETKLTHVIGTFTRVLLLTSMLIFSTIALSQDIHYSQIFQSPLNLSPALAGIYGGEHRFVANARNQWRSANQLVGYNSASLSYDTKLSYTPGVSGFWGIGGQFNLDRAGDSRLSLAQLGLNVSRTQRLSERHLITLGAQLAGGQRAFDTDNLLFNDQYTAGKTTLDPTSQVFDNTTKLYPSLSVGGNWRYQVRESRTFINIGGGLYHLNTPNVNFDNEAEVQLEQRASAYILGTIMLTDRVDLLANFSHQWQGPHREPLAGIRGKFYIQNPLIRNVALQAGVHYRFDDAIIPVVAANVDGWEVGFSYDLNLSQFDVASNTNGGPELSVIYTFQRIQPQICLLCPEYL